MASESEDVYATVNNPHGGSGAGNALEFRLTMETASLGRLLPSRYVLQLQSGNVSSSLTKALFKVQWYWRIL
jgi:hypothetical protein